MEKIRTTVIMLNAFKKIFNRPFTFDKQHIIHQELSLDIREADLHDLNDVMILQEKIYPEQQPWNRQTYTFELTNRKSMYLVVEHQDELVAILGISRRKNNEAHITNIGVVPKLQNMKIGHLLLDICFKLVKENEYKKLTLEVDTQNLSAIRLYKSLGFYEIQIRKNYYDNGHDGIELCKQIS